MKIRVFFLSAIAAFLMCSCINIEEEITLDKKGKGTYRFTMDLGQLLAFMELEDLFKEFDNLSEDDYLTSTEDDYFTGESDNFNLFKDIPNKIDTVLSISDMISGNAEILKKANVRMQVDKDIQQYLVTFEMDFDHVSEINDFFEALNNVEDSSPFANLMQQPLQEDFFNWSKRKLIRNKPSTDISNEFITGEDLEMVRIFFSGAKYTTIYNLPGKVKSTNIPNAKIEGNKVTIENNLIDLIAGDVNVFGDIKFKRK